MPQNQNSTPNIAVTKSFFFDLIVDKEHSNNFALLNQKLIQYLKEVTASVSVHLYMYNKWKEQYLLEQSTEQIVRQSASYALMKERLEEVKASHAVVENVYRAEGLWHTQEEKNDYIVLLNFTKDSREISGFLYFTFTNKEVSDRMLHFLSAIGNETSKLMECWKRHYGSLNEEDRYEQLYRVTAKFHSTMNIDEVLEEVIRTLQDVYPSFDCVLLLSHDYDCYEELPIRDLQYGTDTANQAAVQAYLTGDVQFEDSLIDGRSTLYAPLKGKQGIYGVLQVSAPNTLVFPKQEVGFIELLANTAGSALENAQLYQQSRKLISDLQLINQTIHRLNSNLRLNDTIRFMVEQIKTSFDGQEIGFLVFQGDGKFEVLNGSTNYFFLDEAKSLMTYMNEKINTEKEAFFIGDLALDSNIEHISYRSLMVVPMLQSNILIGAVYVLHEKPYYFSFDKFKLLQSLIQHTTLAFTNSKLREELEKMVITDHLTRLYSRKYLDEKIQLSMDTDVLGAFILIDIDNFKYINDTFGHQVGDEVIIQVANIIKKSIREQDIGARWGGEELAIYLPKADIKTGIKVAKRLVKRVQEETDPKITISCGITMWRKGHSDSVKNLFYRADQALYKAKGSGKNRVMIYEK